MADSAIPDTEQLVQRAAAGDQAATQQLITRHRARLKRLVSVRLDRRLASRIDPSDVVQETLAQAADRLSGYLRNRPLPFYPWIRQLAVEQVIHHHRQHLQAQGRSLTREEEHAAPLPDHSAMALAKRLVTNGTSPSQQVIRKETRAAVRRALDQLKEQDREVLVLRYLEQLSTAETAAVLGLSEAGVKSRQRRALERFCHSFVAYSGEEPL